MQGIEGEHGEGTAGASASPSLSAPTAQAAMPDPAAIRWPHAVLPTVFLLGLLDYADRAVLASVLAPMEAAFKVDDSQAGGLAWLFLVSFAAAAPLMGYAGDRYRRGWLLAAGMLAWSLGTLGCGLARDFSQFRIARVVIGVGVGTYAAIAPTLLADLFARERRARVMSWFFLSIPAGGAAGMVIGGVLGALFGWQTPFLAMGSLGLLAAGACLLLPELIRGRSEGVDHARLLLHERFGPSEADYIDMMVNSSVNYSIFGTTFFTFAMGGLAYWLPTFLIGVKGFRMADATTRLALTTFSAAAIGMGLGGWLTDRWSKTYPRALFLLPSLAMFAAVPFLLAAIYDTRPIVIYGGIFAAEALMFVNVGPCAAILANVVTPNMRGVAFAAAVATSHLLGDLWSPTLMGWVSSTFGREDSMMTVFGRLFAALGALPTVRPGQSAQNLTAGMLVVIPAMILSGIVLLSGVRHLPRETALMLAKLRAHPRPTAKGRAAPVSPR